MIEVPEELPNVFIAVLVNYPTPFLLEAFKRIENLNYPKKKIVLYVWNHVRLCVCVCVCACVCVCVCCINIVWECHSLMGLCSGEVPRQVGSGMAQVGD